MSENAVMIGADPETFVIGTIKDNRGRAVRHGTIPAFGLFGGNKDAPKPMNDLADGFMYLEDNAALEFNIPPQKTADDFVDAINSAKTWMGANLLDPKGLTFSDSNELELDARYYNDPRSKEVGCLADHDAYLNEGAARDAFNAERLGNYRYAGGHIHLSYNCEILPQYVAARFLDLFLALPWLEYDRQHRRRQVYGKGGLFRPKKYGIEYRTMSNWWLWMGDATLRNMADNALTFARRTYDREYLGLLSEAYEGMPWADVDRAVTNEDFRLSSQLLDLADRTYNLQIRDRGGRRRR